MKRFFAWNLAVSTVRFLTYGTPSDRGLSFEAQLKQTAGVANMVTNAQNRFDRRAVCFLCICHFFLLLWCSRNNIGGSPFKGNGGRAHATHVENYLVAPAVKPTHPRPPTRRSLPSQHTGERRQLLPAAAVRGAGQQGGVPGGHGGQRQGARRAGRRGWGWAGG